MPYARGFATEYTPQILRATVGPSQCTCHADQSDLKLHALVDSLLDGRAGNRDMHSDRNLYGKDGNEQDGTHHTAQTCMQHTHRSESGDFT